MKKKILSRSSILVLLGLFIIFLSFGPLIKDEVWYYFMKIKNQKYMLEDSGSAESDTVFGRFLSKRPIKVVPVNKDFSIVIEKIGVNAPIVADVTVTNENIYREALKSGVAHAAFSDYPSEKPGNVYLFAHASLNFWDLGKYSTVFNLLRKLEVGDRVYIFFKGDTYIYEVTGREVVPGWDMRPIRRTTVEPIITLQTCDPPGTTLNRFVVTAKLSEVQRAK